MGKFRMKNGVAYLDDGGAAKSNERLLRRRRNRILQVVKYPICIAIIYLSLSVFLDSDAAVEMGIRASSLSSSSSHHEATRRTTPTNNDDESGDSVKNIHKGKNKNKTSKDENESETKHRWTRDSILPPMHGQKEWARKYLGKAMRGRGRRRGQNVRDFKTRHSTRKFDWETEAEGLDDDVGPKIDYTEHEYEYPDFLPIPPRGGAYPEMEPLGDILERWPQDNIDTPPFPFVERLQHFDFNEPEDMEAARRYRDIEFPFKLINVPELFVANEKWTDEYVSYHFDRNRKQIRRSQSMRELDELYHKVPQSDGHCQESVDSFFAFFTAKHWEVEKMGPAPTLDNDFSYERWAAHARYADAVGLDETKPHYYWQSGVSRRERIGPEDEQTMISLDLPSFSDPEPNFISFNPPENKGIQCRFGERGVTAATHYDGGRNMVGMITGAKRYILSPPKECPKLGIVTDKRHPTFRHSLLNFGHINILDSDESATMPDAEREWLETARTSMTVDTVLKAGEILYIPSHWFHYIVSLQKSAQCNVRSGREFEGTEEWGSSRDVMRCVGEESD